MMSEKTFYQFKGDQNDRLYLLGEHAGFAIPKDMDRLGVPRDVFKNDPNFAGDHGTRRILFKMAKSLKAPMIAGHYARIIADLNRDPGSPEMFWQVQHGVPVPYNQNLSDEAKAQREALFHRPFHAALEQSLTQICARGGKPYLFSVHSFTPKIAKAGSSAYQDIDIGILFIKENPLALALYEYMKGQNLRAGLNAPYDLMAINAGSLPLHQKAHGLEGCAIEINVENLKSVREQDEWARRLIRFFENYFTSMR